MECSRAFEIGVLAERTGCSVDTIRYYERIALLPPVPRTRGGHRLYTDAHSRRITFIRRSRELGLSLKQIRDLIAGIDGNAYACSDARRLLEQRAARIRARIEELEVLERDLRAMLRRCGDAELTNCRIIEAMLAGEGDVRRTRCCS